MDGINAYALSTNSTRKLAFHCNLSSIFTTNGHFLSLTLNFNSFGSSAPLKIKPSNQQIQTEMVDHNISGKLETLTIKRKLSFKRLI